MVKVERGRCGRYKSSHMKYGLKLNYNVVLLPIHFLGGRLIHSLYYSQVAWHFFFYIWRVTLLTSICCANSIISDTAPTTVQYCSSILFFVLLTPNESNKGFTTKFMIEFATHFLILISHLINLIWSFN